VRSRLTILLFVVFLALLAVVLFLKPRAQGELEVKLVDVKVEDVQKMTLKKGSDVIGFQKDEKGDWTITEPIPAKADSFEVNRLAEDFSSLKLEKVVDENPKDPAAFGLPQTEVSLWVKGQDKPVTIALGSENPLDNTIYARRAGETRVVLLPGLIKTDIEKKLLDFRQKDIFHFETADAATIALRAKDIRWEAALKAGEWFLLKPTAGLAQKTKVDALLNALSGLRAKEFAVEQKTPADLKKHGLDKPDYEISLGLPKSNQTLVFLAQKKDGKVYVTTSASDKIVVAEDQALTDMEKKPDDMREKRVDVFNAWEAEKLVLLKPGLDLTVAKDKPGNWYFVSGEKGEADTSKVESFIRQVGTLEAVELIDKPGPLASYGLDKPQAEVKVVVPSESGQKHEIVLLIGSEDKAKKQMVVKNARFDYLFRVGSTFLDELPKAAKDWKTVEAKVAPQEKKP
jgi:hypothetical protein